MALCPVYDTEDFPTGWTSALTAAEDLRDRCCDDLRLAWRTRVPYRRANVVRAMLALRMAIGAEAQARRGVQMEAVHGAG